MKIVQQILECDGDELTVLSILALSVGVGLLWFGWHAAGWLGVMLIAIPASLFIYEGIGHLVVFLFFEKRDERDEVNHC